MLDQDESDNGDGVRKPSVEKKVLLEEISSQHLIDELIEREKLVVVTAKTHYTVCNHREFDANYMSAILDNQCKELFEYVSKNNLVEHDVVHNGDVMEYTSVIVMLALIPRKNPI